MISSVFPSAGGAAVRAGLPAAKAEAASDGASMSVPTTTGSVCAAVADGTIFWAGAGDLEAAGVLAAVAALARSRGAAPSEEGEAANSAGTRPKRARQPLIVKTNAKSIRRRTKVKGFRGAAPKRLRSDCPASLNGLAITVEAPDPCWPSRAALCCGAACAGLCTAAASSSLSKSAARFE